MPDPSIITVKISMLILSYLPLIDFFNVLTCSKLFYSICRENEQLNITLKDSRSLIKCFDLLERYWGLAFSDFKDDFFLEKVSIFVHYQVIIYSSKDKNFSNNYGNFGPL